MTGNLEGGMRHHSNSRASIVATPARSAKLTSVSRPRDVHFAKLLSLVLRHRPETLGVTLDGAGYVDVAQLLAALAAAGQPLTRADLDRIVRDDDKQRFAFDGSGTRLRASQGHSLAVELAYPVRTPPATLYHGTVARFIDAIAAEGLRPQSRQFVHLSADIATATTVGQRRGKPILLTIDAAAMAHEQLEFRLSDNGVWLVRAVPPRFIRFPASTA